jgi:integrase
MRPAEHGHKAPRGLSKRTDRCTHASWASCACPWYAFYRGVKRNLNEWWLAHAPEGHSKTISTQDQAERIFGRFKDAVDHGTYLTPEVTLDSFAQLVQRFKEEKVGIKLREALAGPRKGQMIEVLSGVTSSGDQGEHDAFVIYALDDMVEAFGRHKLKDLDGNAMAFKLFIDGLRKKREWGHGDPKRATRTWNRWFQLGRRLFQYAEDCNMVKENPFTAAPNVFFQKPEAGVRERRIDLVHEKKVEEIFRKKLLNDLSDGWPTLSEEMERRWYAGTQLGLRADEMLRIQVKHIERKPVTVTVGGAPQKVYKITVPSSKGEKTTGRQEYVFAGGSEIVQIIEQRMFLKPEQFVFGRNDGKPVTTFIKSWHKLFELAGMNPPREEDDLAPRFTDEGYVWHDLRHEYISRLVDNGATEAELLACARLSSLAIARRYVTARSTSVHLLATKVGK